MWRIIDGIAFEGKQVDGAWKAALHDFGNGQREVVVQPVIEWREHGPARLYDDEYNDIGPALESTEVVDEDEKREANRRRAARRAKTKVRRGIKALGLDALLTLTYRANQTDLAVTKRHMKEFVRRIRRVIPGFSYVAAFERQERGAWHVHMAMHRLPKDLPWGTAVKAKSFNVVRAIWRSVVGEMGGNIDQQARKRHSQQSCGKLAAYLSKYMLKAFEEGDDWSNRYSGSSFSLPEPVRAEFRGATLRDLLVWAYQHGAPGSCRISAFLPDNQSVFFLSSESEDWLHT